MRSKDLLPPQYSLLSQSGCIEAQISGIPPGVDGKKTQKYTIEKEFKTVGNMIETQIKVSGLNSNRRMVVGAFFRVRVASQC